MHILYFCMLEIDRVQPVPADMLLMLSNLLDGLVSIPTLVLKYTAHFYELPRI